MAKRTLDRAKSFSTCHSLTPRKNVFFQDGAWFDAAGVFVEEIEQPAAPVVGGKRGAKKSAKDVTVERAKDILGDLGPDPARQAARENANAAAAENLSEDA